MNHLRRSIHWTGGLMLAALALTMAVPRAAHAVVAALVQVTNTAATPAITQPVSTMASQQILLLCLPASDACYRYIPGQPSTLPLLNFVVPSGQSLVITGIHISSDSVPVTVSLFPVPFSPGINSTISWTFAGDNLTHDALIPNGIVWPGGNVISFGTSNNGVFWIYGYLTAN